MKRCSSWNWDTLDYTYWQCPGVQSQGGWDTPPKRKPIADTGIGIDIEDALPHLSSGCKRVGRGVQAAGQIVRVNKALAGIDAISGVKIDIITILSYGAVGLLGFAIAAWIASELRKTD